MTLQTTVLPLKIFVCPGCGKAFAARVATWSGRKQKSDMIGCIYCGFTQHQKLFKKVVE
jgi:predicted RNA-binding Zn-ribbon protein involved in translation (DUF1610 family)